MPCSPQGVLVCSDFDWPLERRSLVSHAPGEVKVEIFAAIISSLLAAKILPCPPGIMERPASVAPMIGCTAHPAAHLKAHAFSESSKQDVRCEAVPPKRDLGR